MTTLTTQFTQDLANALDALQARDNNAYGDFTAHSEKLYYKHLCVLIDCSTTGNPYRNYLLFWDLKHPYIWDITPVTTAILKAIDPNNAARIAPSPHHFGYSDVIVPAQS